MVETSAPVTSSWAECGLLLVGHGSRSYPDGALVINRLIRALREKNLFAEVEAGFLHQGPRIETIVEAFSAKRIYVVPVLASRGYTADTVVTGRLELEGPVTMRQIGGTERTFILCDPLGTNSSVPATLAERIAEVKARHGLATGETEILLVGHGTRRNRESARRTREIAELLEGLGAARRVHAAFLDQAPKVDDWRDLVGARSILVVPFLMASWFHGARDLPERISLDPLDPAIRSLLLDPGAAGPFTVGDHRLWYLSPFGNEPGLAETAVAVIRDFDANHSFRSPTSCTDLIRASTGNGRKGK